MKRTVLHSKHALLNAKMTEVQGWQIPLQFTDTTDEYHAVRTAAGLFDISFLGRIEVSGPGSAALLQKTLTRSVSKIPEGTAHYSLICNEAGGVLDDPIVFHLPGEPGSGARFLLTTGASNAEKVCAWLKQNAVENTRIIDRSAELAHLALQGPRSFALIEKIAGTHFKRPKAGTLTQITLFEAQVLVARTGYTGEHGYEIMLPADRAERVWNAVMNAGLESGIRACGFASRDILRMESGYVLYGNEIDETRSPIESGLERLIDFKKDFIGKEALVKIKTEGVKQKLVGFKLLDKGMPKTGGSIFSESHEIGVVTSNCHSPLVRADIGMGYVMNRYAQTDQEVEVEVRDKEISARIVELPFRRK